MSVPLPAAGAQAPARKGRLITFEGGEGAGKSTQIRFLCERLAQSGVEVVLTREPGGTPHAEKLRALLLSGRAARFGPFGEALLFCAARIDHIDMLIAPALTRGAVVLSDRFADSTRAYQGVMGKADPHMIALLERVALGDLRPDLTIVLDLPAKEGLARASARRGAEAEPDRFEREEIAFHEGLRRAFLHIAAGEPDRCCVIDALQPKEEVAQAIWQLVEARFLGPANQTAPT
jgi:dTMP kinase